MFRDISANRWRDPTKSEREKYGAQARLGGYTTKEERGLDFSAH